MRKIKELLINLGCSGDTVCNLSFRSPCETGDSQAPINTRRNARHTFVLRRGARGSLSDARITRKFPGAVFDQITSALEAGGAVSIVRICYMPERTSRIDFIRCRSSIRLIDGNAVKRATLRLLARHKST